MKKREPRPDDQQKIQEYVDRFHEFIQLNNIDPERGVSAMFSLIANAFKASGHTIETFSQNIELLKNHYIKLWDESDG